MIGRTASVLAMVATGAMLNGLVATRAGAQEAKQTYEKSCASCHGPGGKGDGPASKLLKPPAADFATALKGKADADIAKVIKEGGKAVGKAPTMPSFGAKLTDDQIHGVVEYIKGFASK
jgi:mono/diheme cytochrome c family protein